MKIHSNAFFPLPLLSLPLPLPSSPSPSPSPSLLLPLSLSRANDSTSPTPPRIAKQGSRHHKASGRAQDIDSSLSKITEENK